MSKLEDLQQKYIRHINELKSLAKYVRVSYPAYYMKLFNEILELEEKLNQIYKVTGKFDILKKDIDFVKENSLSLMDEETIMMWVASNSITEKTENNTKDISSRLHCKKENNFEVNQDLYSNPFKTNVNAKEFNELNKNLEIVLENGYNASITNQFIEISKVTEKLFLPAKKTEIYTILCDKLGLKTKGKNLSYSTFNAKFNTLNSMMNLYKYDNFRLSKANKLYIYNAIITLLDEVNKNNIDTSKNQALDNLEILDAMENDMINHLITKLNDDDVSNLNDLVLAKTNELNSLRKELEFELFEKTENKFSMKKCSKMFNKSALEILRNQNEKVQ